MDMDEAYADKVREFIEVSQREKNQREGFIPTVRKTAAYVVRIKASRSKSGV